MLVILTAMAARDAITTRRPAARAVASAMALLVLASAAGCGPSEEEQFRKQQLDPLRAQIDMQRSRLGQTIKTESNTPQGLKLIKVQVEQLDAMVRRLGGLRPPDSVRSQMRQYVIANAGIVASLRRFVSLLPRSSGLNAAAYQTQVAIGRALRADQALQAALRRS
jgi:hypothetical protein